MKLAFWSVFVVGFVLCSTLGIGPTLSRVGGNWAAPAMIVGSLLGVALLALAVLFAAGVRPAFLATDMAMLIALGVLIAAKVAVALAQAASTSA